MEIKWHFNETVWKISKIKRLAHQPICSSVTSAIKLHKLPTHLPRMDLEALGHQRTCGWFQKSIDTRFIAWSDITRYWTSKLRVTGLCAGNSPGTDEFPAQMASNAENVSIWWRHHVIGSLLRHTEFVAWLSNYIHAKTGNEITHPWLQLHLS